MSAAGFVWNVCHACGMCLLRALGLRERAKVGRSRSRFVHEQYAIQFRLAIGHERGWALWGWGSDALSAIGTAGVASKKTLRSVTNGH